MHASSRLNSLVLVSIKSLLNTDAAIDSTEFCDVMLNKIQNNTPYPEFYSILVFMIQYLHGMLNKYPQMPNYAIEDYSVYMLHLTDVLESITQISCLITQQALLEESQPMGASWEKFDEAYSELFNALWHTVTIYRGENRTIIERNLELSKVPSIIITMIITMQHYRARSMPVSMALNSSALIRENETIERCAAAMRIFHDAVNLIPEYTVDAEDSPPRTLMYRDLLSKTEQTSRMVSLVNRHTPLRKRSCVKNCLKEQFSLLMITIELLAKNVDAVYTYCYIPISKAKDIILSEAEAFASNACIDNRNSDAEHRVILTRFSAAFIPLYKSHIWSRLNNVNCSKRHHKVANSVSDCLRVLLKALELHNVSKEKDRLRAMAKTSEYSRIVEDFRKYLDELPELILEQKKYNGPEPKCTQVLSDAYISMLWIPEYIEQLLNAQLPLERKGTPRNLMHAPSVKPGNTSKTKGAH
ncbi:hypothetical protein EPHNCH_1141 [Anaplasma phagocytophilum str. NCH-1]|uniref:Uncharacterized protein n=2 Tax=Anaplasma phagocytophilum TaxID=948 RepID=Q2GJQ5_ANAPZ|nr:hypothetical protein APH_0819 [Anaplasma phagocytophilum str. HZ]AGR79495.1 hypothetical protein YYU_03810 [Anaplasma phagocytophilum str. HZ2]KJV63093.1 hypothetical protein EPHNCH_1141 [Anaplasma phagocytophilum str. NCH-1]KJV86981.1 hypothetical protein APHNYW_0832 [Anaplasma phagocytophilum str. ApNYW]